MKYNANFLVLDVESGGLPQVLKKAATIEVALTEVAMVVVDNESLEIIDQFSCLLKPYKEGLIYDLKALEVSHITKDLLNKEGLDMSVAFPKICDFINKHTKGKQKMHMIGHNLIKFDLEFIVNLFEFNKKDISDYLSETMFDTLEFARIKMIESPKFNLATVLQAHQIDIVDAHRALTDTIATAKLWIKFMKNLRGESGSQSNNNQVAEKRFREQFEF